MPLMFFGIGLLGYVLSVAASTLVQAKTKELHGMSSYDKLKNHLVIINLPSLSKVEHLLDELESDPKFGKGRDIVLIDEDLTELPTALLNRGLMFVRGNPTRDETLTRASVDTAPSADLQQETRRSTLGRSKYRDRPGDRGRTPQVHTVTECVDFSAQELLKKAGCEGSSARRVSTPTS